MQVLFTPIADIDVIAPTQTGRPWLADAAYRGARGRYLDLFGPTVAGMGRTFRADADAEDWHENVARLLSALDTGMDVHVIERSAHRTGEISPVLSLTDQPFDRTRPTLLLGAEPRHSVLHGTDPSQPASDLNIVWPRRGCAEAANAYAETGAFARYAGRRIALCDVPGEIPGDGPRGRQIDSDAPRTIAATLARWASQGPVDALLKVVSRAKYGPLEALTLPQGADLETANRAVVAALGYNLLDLEGRTGAVLAQDRIAMHDEYRVFVVDHTPVTGAGCIEHHTPWDRIPGNTFDPQLQATRNAAPVRQDPERVAAYRRFAAAAASALRSERPDLKDYALDLAVDAAGTPLIVELNPIGPSGLYACQIHKLLRAIRDAGPRACIREAA